MSDKVVCDAIVIEVLNPTHLAACVDKIKRGFLINNKETQTFHCYLDKENDRLIIVAFVEKVVVDEESKVFVIRTENEYDRLETLDISYHKDIEILLDKEKFTKVVNLVGMEELDEFIKIAERMC